MLNRNDILARFYKTHGNLYDYSLFTEYKGIKSKIDIICSVHGKFNQCIDNHYLGNGCPLCGQTSRENKYRLGKTNFIRKSKEIHGDRYDYNLVKYTNNATKVKIKCKIHGIFEQTPGSHLLGRGCRICCRKTMGGYGGYNIKNAEKFKSEWINKKATVYIVKLFNDEESFYKVGITVQPRILDRFKGVPYKREVFSTIKTNLYDGIRIEKTMLDKFKEFKYKPNLKFKGYKECFTNVIVN